MPLLPEKNEPVLKKKELSRDKVEIALILIAALMSAVISVAVFSYQTDLTEKNEKRNIATGYLIEIENLEPVLSEEGHATLAEPRDLLRSWVIRFGEPALLNQTFFEPYMAELADLPEEITYRGKDVWKGRNASSVDANTVKGPVPLSAPSSLAALTAATRVLNLPSATARSTIVFIA
jgi:hypothetical protein